jgi:hypothetical protein
MDNRVLRRSRNGNRGRGKRKGSVGPPRTLLLVDDASHAPGRGLTGRDDEAVLLEFGTTRALGRRRQGGSRYE